MYKIAICDDSISDREHIFLLLKAIQSNHGTLFDVAEFSDGSTLCNNIPDFDIILLDIIMDDMDGIQTARKIRSMGGDSLIIFISSYDERLRELFGANVIGFIDKPSSQKKLEDALSEAYKLIDKNIDEIFRYNKNGSIFEVPIKNIVYFEAQLNDIELHTTGQNISYRGKLEDVWACINKHPSFIRPARSYICNLKHLSMDTKKVYVPSLPEGVNIGRTFKDDTLMRYHDYLEYRSK